MEMTLDLKKDPSPSRNLSKIAIDNVCSDDQLFFQNFMKSLEFDFSKRRSQKRKSYLSKYGINDLSSFAYSREEGIDELTVLEMVKKTYDINYDIELMKDEKDISKIR